MDINEIILNGDIYSLGGSGTGLTEEAKTALLACFQNVAWIDEDGQDYYDALEEALNSEPSPTPTGHTPLWWIKSDGNQYINTGLVLDYYDEVSITLIDTAPNTVDAIYWGVTTGGSENYRVQMGPLNSTISGRWTGDGLSPNAWITNGRKQNLIRKYEFVNNSSSVKTANAYDNAETLLGTAIAINGNQLNMPDLPVYLFGRNNFGICDVPVSFKLIEFVVKNQQGTERMHLIPVLKGGVPCVYDTISNSYLYNSGTGSFTYHETLPGEVIELELNTMSESSAVGTDYYSCKSSNGQRYRTIDPVAISQGDVIHFSATGIGENTLKCFYLFFDSNKAYTGIYSEQWADSPLTITDDYPYIGLIFKTDTNQSAINAVGVELAVSIVRSSS